MPVDPRASVLVRLNDSLELHETLISHLRSLEMVRN